MPRHNKYDPAPERVFAYHKGEHDHVLEPHELRAYKEFMWKHEYRFYKEPMRSVMWRRLRRGEI